MLSDIEFKELLDYYNRSWSGYRRVRKGVKKRLRREMVRLGVRSIPQYLVLLEESAAETEIFERCMGVTISRFFRDNQLWHHLLQVVVPQINHCFPDSMKMWSAGCSCGEEAYSIAIVLDCLELSKKASILATDFNEENLHRAQQGIYNNSSLKELPETLKSRYLHREAKGKYSVQPFLRKRISWKRHDLFFPPPEGGFHLIFLRNSLLTYHREAAIRDVLEAIVRSLVPGGFLVVGVKEQLRMQNLNLVADPNYPYIYRHEKNI